MTDRELLELAAKAAGAKRTDYSDRTPDHWIFEHRNRVWLKWNPLTDDGDALRLAVKLAIRIAPEVNSGDVAAASLTRDFVGDVAVEEHGDDRYAATRRAITRAAAAIGKAMD